MLIPELLPTKVPPAWSQSTVAAPELLVVILNPLLWVTVPVYPDLIATEPTVQFTSIAALLSQSASNIASSPEPGTPAPPPVHDEGLPDDQLAAELMLPPLVPTQ